MIGCSEYSKESMAKITRRIKKFSKVAFIYINGNWLEAVMKGEKTTKATKKIH